MRFIATALAFLMMFTASVRANEPDLAAAQGFVTQLADDAITILSANKDRASREAAFAKLLDERANMRRIARFTLGQFGRQISKDDFTTYEALLGDFIVKVYANRLGEYSEEKVIVGKAQAKKKNVIVIPQGRIKYVLYDLSCSFVENKTGIAPRIKGKTKI